MAYSKVRIWDHEDHLRRALSKRGIATIKQQYDYKNITLKKVYVGDKVIVPGNRIGKVHLIDEDDVICVELDPTSDLLHEFNRDEVIIYKKNKKNKKRS